MANDGTIDETKQPSGVMVNADGEWVVAEPDKASWDQYQARAKVSAAAQEIAARGDKILQERGLECPIDKRLFVEPSKTPCCQTTYCLECITNALLENDLRCPQCNTENILLDDLKPDDQMNERIRNFELEELSSQAPEAVNSPNDGSGHEKLDVEPVSTEKAQESNKTRSDITLESPSKCQITSTGSANSSKKRPADGPLVNTRTPPPPSAEIAKKGVLETSQSKGNLPSSVPTGNLGLNQTLGPGMLPASSAFMNLPMSMMPSMPNLMGAYDPMLMMSPMLAGNNSNWTPMWNGAFPQQQYAMAGGGYPNGMPNGHFGTQNMQLPINSGFTSSNGTGLNHGSGRGNFSNQQRNHFAGSKTSEEDSAYFRKPVNPHRHQTRRNINRPMDYREI